MSIIEAIWQREPMPGKLASLRHGNCRKSEAEIAKAPSEQWPQWITGSVLSRSHLYKVLQEKIELQDKEIEKLLREQI